MALVASVIMYSNHWYAGSRLEEDEKKIKWNVKVPA